VSSSQCSRCHRASQVPVHVLEPLLSSEARPDVAKLLHMVKARQASHHFRVTEPLEGLEVKMLKRLCRRHASSSRREARQRGCATCTSSI
jgi:hypothetical protein